MFRQSKGCRVDNGQLLPNLQMQAENHAWLMNVNDSMLGPVFYCKTFFTLPATLHSECHASRFVSVIAPPGKKLLHLQTMRISRRRDFAHKMYLSRNLYYWYSGDIPLTFGPMRIEQARTLKCALCFFH